MAKTDQELFADFKNLTNRPDWTMDDFVAARNETDSNIIDAIQFAKSVSFIYAASDSVLQAAVIYIDSIRAKIQGEIDRRNA